MRFDDVIANIKGCNFCATVYNERAVCQTVKKVWKYVYSFRQNIRT